MQITSKAWGRRFASDERGAVAIMFGLSFLMLVFAIGMGVDYTRAISAKSRLGAAADAAALAAGKALLDGRNTEDEARNVARLVFDQNLGSIASEAVISDFDIVVDRGTGSVKVEFTASLPSRIMQVANYDSVTMPIDSAVLYDQHDIELGMALDTTGSMSGAKIADLKAASKELVDILMPDDGTPNKVRIGIAPYSASIKLGPYAALASNNASTDGCVRERTAPASRYSDAAPVAGAFYAAGAAADIDPTEGRQGYACPSAVLRPLTTSKAALKTTIDSMRANGATAGHIGATWAWNLISPNWDLVWPNASKPAAYNDGKTLKAVILMTDGIFNMAYANDRSSAQAIATCQNMKAENVVVYAVGFQAPAGAAATLRACASGDDKYFDAADGTALRQAFITIAQQLNALRLTQ